MTVVVSESNNSITIAENVQTVTANNAQVTVTADNEIITVTTSEIPVSVSINGQTDSIAIVEQAVNIVNVASQIGLESVVAGVNISIDSSDPLNPVINSLSDRYKTTSTTSQAIVSTGTITFTVGEDLSYVSQQEVIIAYDSNNHMHGTVVSYSGTSLVVEIRHKTGSGTYSAWSINLDGTPVDALTGTGTIDEVGIFTASRVLGSTNIKTINSTSLLGSGDITISASPAGSTGRIQVNIDGAFGADSNFIWDNTNKRQGVQVAAPRASQHVAAVVGSSIANVTSGSVSLVDEVLPSAPTGSITAIPMPVAPISGTLSFVDQGSGGFNFNDGDIVTVRQYQVLSAAGVYYESQNYADVVATVLSGTDTYNLAASFAGGGITGETTLYSYYYDVNGGGFNQLNISSNQTETFSGTSSFSITPWPTYYTAASGTPPNAYTGGSASAINQGFGGISQYNTTILLEVDSVANIGGTNYVSGSPTSGSFDDSVVSAPYDAEITWSDNGNATNSIVRISVDGGSTWYYQYTGSSSSPYVFTSLSNDTDAESRWGQTYTAGSATFSFYPYSTSTSISNNTIYSAQGSLYSTVISDTNYYILKHAFSSATGKALDESLSYGQSFTGSSFYDAGYTSWANGVTVSPNSYGFSGSAQNRDYRVYGFSSGQGIYSPVPLTLSTVSSGGVKYVSGTVSYPSGITQIKIIRQVNGGGYTASKTISSPVTTFTDDSTDGSWSGDATVTPTTIIGTAGRFDRETTSVTDQPILAVVATGSGARYPKLSFGSATNAESDATYHSHLYASSTTGYLNATTARFEIAANLGATPSTLLGNANVINNNNSSSTHFQVKGLSDSSLINTRSDLDTVGFGQAIGSDQQTTVQTQPARVGDAGQVYIGHASHTDASTMVRFQTSAGAFTAEITMGGWFRASTGAAATPSHSCRSDTNTGAYFPAADTYAITTGGTERARWDSSGNYIIGSTSSAIARIDVTQPTLGTNVYAYTSIATDNDPTIRCVQNRVATTNATATTLHTFAIPSNTTVFLNCTVIARRTGGSAGANGDSAAYMVKACYRNISGTVTLVGAILEDFTAENQAAWVCTFTISGTNVLLQVTGALNNNITWHLAEGKSTQIAS